MPGEIVQPRLSVAGVARTDGLVMGWPGDGVELSPGPSDLYAGLMIATILPITHSHFQPLPGRPRHSGRIVGLPIIRPTRLAVDGPHRNQHRPARGLVVVGGRLGLVGR